ncbi:MAG: protein kinase [Candidatus Latescibacterota bacterium]|nr:MAG: protein kinase [Candidatus Latescibacterota bacterium]
MTTGEEKKRFVNEAQAAAQLSHPNICTIYEIDSTEGHTYISMAHIPGENLERKIAGGPLKLDHAVTVAIELCGALREAHSQDVIHRDIKPANIMISDKGPAILLDFGLAMLKGQSRITKVGSTVGTSAYMSPEQTRGEGVDHRTDIWSLGVVLYEMITGLKPFKGEHEATVIYSIVNADPEPVTALRTGVPMELERIIRKALAKNPSERYQHVDDMLVDLDAVRQDLSGPRSTTTVRPRVEPKPSRRSLWISVLSFFACIVLIVVVVWFSQGRGPSEGDRPGTTTSRPLTSPEIQPGSSIAVLPLANLSRNNENEFFVDGMTEELISQLARIKALKVISRTSVMKYKNTDKSLTEIAEELNVATILEGSVLWAGDNVRISVQLIDGVNDRHIWANSFESDMSDVLGLQRRVAKEVASQIQVELSEQEEDRLAVSPVVNKEAYELYLQGRFHWNKRRRESIQRAIDFYQKALELDPEYALAYAGLAESYAVLATWGAADRAREAHPMAREMAQKALEIDDDLAGAHAVLGVVAYEYDWDWDAAEAHFKRAIELNPNYASAHQWYAEMLTSIGRRDEAVREIRIAQEIDPLSLIISTVAGFALILNGDPEAGFAEYERVIDLDPTFPPVYLTQRYGYYWIGEWEKGSHSAIKYFELTADDDQARQDAAALKEALARGGVEEFDRTGLEILRRFDREGYVDPVLMASVLARLGEVDSALVWLERGYNERAHPMSTMLRDRSFERLESDPRYMDLLKRMKLDHTPGPP